MHVLENNLKIFHLEFLSTSVALLQNTSFGIQIILRSCLMLVLTIGTGTESPTCVLNQH